MQGGLLSEVLRLPGFVGLFVVVFAEEASEVLSKGWGPRLVTELTHLQSSSEESVRLT